MKKYIARIREILHWPNINSHIKHMISEYQHCTQHRNQQPVETQLKHEIPITPWIKDAIKKIFI